MILERKQHSIKLNFLYNVSYQLLAVILPLITTPYVSRILGADGVGTYSYTLSIATYFSMFGVLGTTTYGQLEISKARNNDEELSRVFWGVVLARVILTSVCIVAYIVLALNATSYKEPFLVLVIYIAAQMADISWFFQGVENFKVVVLRNYIIRIVGVLLIFLLVKGKNDLAVYILILQGSAALGNISLWGYLRKKIKFIKLKYIKRKQITEHIKKSMVYFIPTVATSIYNVLDKSMLGWIIHKSYENGYYEQAQKIEQIALTVVTALSTVTLTRFAFLFNENKNDEIKDLVSLTLKFVMMMSFPMTFGLIGIAPTLIPWFLGADYEKSIILLQICSVLIVIVGLNNTIGKQCLIATKRQGNYNNGVIIGALFNIVINLILIPKLASIGASIATVCAEMIILIVFIKYSKEYFKISDLFIQGYKYFIASFLMLIPVRLVSGLIVSPAVSITIQIMGGIITYFILLIILNDGLFSDYIKRYLAKIQPKTYNLR